MTATKLLNHFDLKSIKCITYTEDDPESHCEYHETNSVYDFLKKFGDRKVVSWKYWGDNSELEIWIEE